MNLAHWIERAKRWLTGARPTPRTSAGESAPRHDGHPTEMRTDHIMCVGPHGIHRMVYYEWGDPTNPKVLLCVHGLTRTGRDFDELARALAPAQTTRRRRPDEVLVDGHTTLEMKYL